MWLGDEGKRGYKRTQNDSRRLCTYHNQSIYIIMIYITSLHLASILLPQEQLVIIQPINLCNSYSSNRGYLDERFVQSYHQPLLVCLKIGQHAQHCIAKSAPSVGMRRCTMPDFGRNTILLVPLFNFIRRTKERHYGPLEWTSSPNLDHTTILCPMRTGPCMCNSSSCSTCTN